MKVTVIIRIITIITVAAVLMAVDVFQTLILLIDEQGWHSLHTL